MFCLLQSVRFLLALTWLPAYLNLVPWSCHWEPLDGATVVLSSEFSGPLSKMDTDQSQFPERHLNQTNLLATAMCCIHCSLPLVHFSMEASGLRYWPCISRFKLPLAHSKSGLREKTLSPPPAWNLPLCPFMDFSFHFRSFLDPRNPLPSFLSFSCCYMPVSGHQVSERLLLWSLLHNFPGNKYLFL